jgi:uncharacterized PurR-regulated membrane protein YhhQ (DUF165 family)
MRRTLLGIFAAVVTGFGLATVLALGTASISAAVFRANTPSDQTIALKVQEMRPAIAVAAGIGFVVGAGVTAWMFLSTKGPSNGPDDDGPEPRSEV